jgi:hypothetical protein
VSSASVAVPAVEITGGGSVVSSGKSTLWREDMPRK